MTSECQTYMTSLSLSRPRAFVRVNVIFRLKPGFHIVVSVVRKKFIGQLQLYGNLPYKCSIQKKRQIQLVVRDRMNSICPMNFFRTTDTTDTTMWKPGFTEIRNLCCRRGNHSTSCLKCSCWKIKHVKRCIRINLTDPLQLVQMRK